MPIHPIHLQLPDIPCIKFLYIYDSEPNEVFEEMWEIDLFGGAVLCAEPLCSGAFLLGQLACFFAFTVALQTESRRSLLLLIFDNFCWLDAKPLGPVMHNNDQLMRVFVPTVRVFSVSHPLRLAFLQESLLLEFPREENFIITAVLSACGFFIRYFRMGEFFTLISN